MAMGISQALKLQKGSLQSIARLPQEELIRMVQAQEIPQTLLPIILEVKAQEVKNKANLQARMQLAQQGQPTTITERNMATIAQEEAQPQANVGIATAPMREDMYNEQTLAGGGIVAFEEGGQAKGDSTADQVEQLYARELGRKSDPEGYKFWTEKFGPEVSADERALFIAEAAPEVQRRMAAGDTGLPSYMKVNPNVRQALQSKDITTDQYKTLANYFGNQWIGGEAEDPASLTRRDYIERPRTGYDLATFLSTRSQQHGAQADTAKRMEDLLAPYVGKTGTTRAVSDEGTGVYVTNPMTGETEIAQSLGVDNMYRVYRPPHQGTIGDPEKGSRYAVGMDYRIDPETGEAYYVGPYTGYYKDRGHRDWQGPLGILGLAGGALFGGTPGLVKSLATSAVTGKAAGGEIRAQSGLYVNPTFSEMLRQRETGGYRGDPNFAVSPKGAMGIMQIMPSTAMKPGFGLPNVFQVADTLGVSYKDKSKDSAEKLLTDPNVNKTFGDLYAGAMLQRFEGDPRLAAAAYNAGPGRVQQAGGVPNIPETQKYVAGISPERFESARKSVQDARREQLKDFSLSPTGKSVMPYRSVMEGKDKPPVDYEALMAAREPKPVTTGLGSTFDPFLQATTPTETTPSGPTKADVAARQQEFVDYLSGRRPITPASPGMAQIAAQQRAAEKKPEAAPPAAAAESPFADFRKYIEGQEKALESQRAEDRAMSILAAGLGILGGTSPYAMANIGQGALQGVALSSKLAEQRSAKEKNLLAARLGLTEADIRDKYYAGQLSARDAANRIAAGRLGATMQGNVIKARKQFMDEGGADKLAAEFEARYGTNWRKNPKLEGDYKLQMNAMIREIAGGLDLSGVRSASSLLGEED